MIKNITGYRYTIPLQRPFAYFTASLSHLPYILLTIETEDGIIGIGEGALAWDVTGENQDGALAHIEILRPIIERSRIDTLDDVRELMDRINLCVYGNTALKTGIESALLDILGHSLRLPIYKLFDGKAREYITLQCTSSFEEITFDILPRAASAYDGGVRIFKLKIGNDLEKERDAIVRLRSVYPDCSIILDANQAWKYVREVRSFLHSIKELNIAWIEQPLHADDYEGHALLRTECGIPVMVDESCHTYSDLRVLHSYGAMDIVNIKLAKCGGIFECIRMVEFCKKNGIRYALGDMIQSSIGTAYNLHTALLGDFIAYDLTLPDRISDDAGEGLVFDGWEALIPKGFGLGVHLRKNNTYTQS